MIQKKQGIVIGVSTSALFNLELANRIFIKYGEAAYRNYQAKNLDKILEKGVAFPLIRRLQEFNAVFNEEHPVDIVLMSRNSPETCARAFRSLSSYGLVIERGAFVDGGSPHPYIPAFGVNLFLSSIEADVRQAIAEGYAAGLVINSKIVDNLNDKELRIAFDFDGVLVDDESEREFKQGGLGQFISHELEKKNIVHNPGPLYAFIKELMYLRALDIKRCKADKKALRLIKVALVTARGGSVVERVIMTLKSWGIEIDETFFMCGKEKQRVLEIFRPHMFFDDQLTHLKNLRDTPAVHIPFGIANEIAIKEPA